MYINNIYIFFLFKFTRKEMINKILFILNAEYLYKK